jgi:exopolysaccharide production protein ExoQ
MPPQIATLAFIALVATMFWLDREDEARVSAAMCLPFIWLWLTASRSVAEWIIILETGHPPLAIDQGTMYMEGSPVDRLVLIALMVLAIIVLVKRKQLVPLLRLNLPIFLFLAYATLTVVWTDFPEVTIRRVFKAVGCVLMIMVVLSERNRDVAVKRLMVAAGFVLVSLSVLYVKYYPAIGRMYNRWTWIVSPVGVTTHKNSLGGLCQIFGIVFVFCFLRAFCNKQMVNRRRHMLAHGIALAMVIWLFLQANSVTAQSCFLLGAAFLCAMSVPSIARMRTQVHALIFTLLAVPFAILFLGVGSSALEGMGRDSTLTGRTDIWQRVIALQGKPIVGVGFESFWLGPRLDSMNKYQQGLNEAHNGFIEFWLALGVVGLIFLAIFIIRGYRDIATLMRFDPEAARLRMAFFITVVVSSYTEAAFRTESISWIVFLLITMRAPVSTGTELELQDPAIQSVMEDKQEAASEYGYEPPASDLVESNKHWTLE